MFGEAIRSYTWSLDSLRTFVELTRPMLEEHARETAVESLALLRPLLVGLDNAGVANFELPDALKRYLSTEESSPSTGLKIRTASDGRIEAVEAPPGYLRELRGKMRDIGKLLHPDLLYNSALVTLITFAECFVSQLLHLYFARYPAQLENKTKEFTLGHIQSFDSLDDVTDYFIETKVEEILRKRLEEWLAWFKKRGLHMSYLKEDRAQLVEIYERRNLVVHTGGKVNSRYVSNLAVDARPDAIAKGEKLTITKKYLMAAIDLVERVFVLLASEFWKQLEADNRLRSRTLLDLAYEHLRAERYKIAEQWSLFTWRDMGQPERNRQKARFNFWQSLKWQDRFDEVAEEVEEADFSAMDDLFSLARYALMDDVDGFFGLLPSVLKSGSLTERGLREWPLFREMRKTDRYKEEYAEPEEFQKPESTQES